MQDIVFDSKTYDNLLTDAQRLGFTHDNGEGQEVISTNGTFEAGGSWFLNVVGTVYAPSESNVPGELPVERPGYWGRLRVNADDVTLPTFSPEITQYKYYDALGGWSSDGVTLAPDWIGTIGQIS